MNAPPSALRPSAMMGLALEGTAVLEAVAGAVGTDRFAGPSHLPDWSLAHVVTHVARNADALVNLLTWARTGVESPMYPDPERRGREIEEGAHRPAGELYPDLLAADRRFALACADLPDGAWQNMVRTARGRQVPVAEVAWMRAREVWVHAVDLLGVTTFADIPQTMAVALLDDVAQGFRTRADVPCVELRDRDGLWTWELGSPDSADPVTVTGDTACLAAWATGRPVPGELHCTASHLPALPSWL